MSRGRGRTATGRRPRTTDHVAEAHLDLDGVDQLALVGAGDANLRFLAARFGGTVSVRGDRLFLKGPAADVGAMQEVCRDLIERVHARRRQDAA